MKKTTIALAEDLLEAVDEAASARGSSRSAFISEVLRHAVRARRDAGITAQINALFRDDESAKAVKQDTQAFDALGTDWSDEDWS